MKNGIFFVVRSMSSRQPLTAGLALADTQPRDGLIKLFVQFLDTVFGKPQGEKVRQQCVNGNFLMHQYFAFEVSYSLYRFWCFFFDRITATHFFLLQNIHSRLTNYE